MRVNICLSPTEEPHVLQIIKFVKHLFPSASVKFSRKEKYQHGYIDTNRKAAQKSTYSNLN